MLVVYVDCDRIDYGSCNLCIRCELLSTKPINKSTKSTTAPVESLSQSLLTTANSSPTHSYSSHFRASERPGIRCTDDVATRQYAIMKALKARLRRCNNGRGSPTTTMASDSSSSQSSTSASALQNGQNKSDMRFSNLIVQLKDLENLNKIHAHHLDWLRSNLSMLRLPTLFSEIFDMPISSKSSTSSVISNESIEDETLAVSIGACSASDSDTSINKCIEVGASDNNSTSTTTTINYDMLNKTKSESMVGNSNANSDISNIAQDSSTMIVVGQTMNSLNAKSASSVTATTKPMTSDDADGFVAESCDNSSIQRAAVEGKSMTSNSNTDLNDKITSQYNSSQRQDHNMAAVASATSETPMDQESKSSKDQATIDVSEHFGYDWPIVVGQHQMSSEDLFFDDFGSLADDPDDSSINAANLNPTVFRLDDCTEPTDTTRANN